MELDEKNLKQLNMDDINGFSSIKFFQLNKLKNKDIEINQILINNFNNKKF